MRILLLTFMCILSTSVNAHDWYPKECCSNKDCAPVLGQPKWLSNSRVEATTKFGTAVFTKNKWRISKDCQYHACMNKSPFLDMYGQNGICLFIPTCS